MLYARYLGRPTAVQRRIALTSANRKMAIHSSGGRSSRLCTGSLVQGASGANMVVQSET